MTYDTWVYCPRCNGEGEEGSGSGYARPCSLCLGQGVIEEEAQPAEMDDDK